MDEWIEIEDDLLEMELDEDVEIGKKMAVAVYAKEGNIAHFHFIKDLHGKNQEEGCLAILKPNYFTHGYKTATLNGKELKRIVKGLKKPYTHGSSQTKYEKLWDYIIEIWNKGADMRPTADVVPIDAPIPEYYSEMDTIQEDGETVSSILFTQID